MVPEPELCSREVNRSRSRLIRKVYETTPFVCPRCRNRRRVIASIKDPKVVRKILENLGLWLANARSALILSERKFLSRRLKQALCRLDSF